MRRLKAIIFFLLLINGQSVATAEDRKTYTLDEMASRIQERTGSHLSLQGEERRPCKGNDYAS